MALEVFEEVVIVWLQPGEAARRLFYRRGLGPDLLVQAPHVRSDWAFLCAPELDEAYGKP